MESSSTAATLSGCETERNGNFLPGGSALEALLQPGTRSGITANQNEVVTSVLACIIYHGLGDVHIRPLLFRNPKPSLISVRARRNAAVHQLVLKATEDDLHSSRCFLCQVYSAMISQSPKAPNTTLQTRAIKIDGMSKLGQTLRKWTRLNGHYAASPSVIRQKTPGRNAEAARILMICMLICVRVRHHAHRPLFDQGAGPLFATVRFDLV